MNRQLNRRDFCGLAGVAASMVTPAFAQGSGRPIRLIVGFGAGTGPDVIMRIVAERMAQQLGQPILVDNKPGGEGIPAAQEAMRAPADGSALYFGSGQSLIATPILRAATGLPYDAFKDFTPVTQLGLFTLALVAAPGLPVNNFGEFVAHVRSRPREYNFATSSINNRLISLQVITQYKLEMTHVPYKAETQGLLDLMANRVHMQSVSIASGVPAHVRDGKLKVLFVQRGTRSTMLPDVPTAREVGADIRISPWSGLFGPAGMPKALAERYAQAYRAAVSADDVRQRFDQLGFEPVPTTPDEMAAMHRTEYEAFGKIVQEFAIKID